MDFRKSGMPLSSIKKELWQYKRMSKLDRVGLNRQLCASYSLTDFTDIHRLLEHVIFEFLESNTLIYHEAGVLEMERQVLSMIATLMNSNEDGTGIFTAGGTESNIIALLAAKNYARKRGSVVLPSNAHPSFFKGCELLGLRVIKVPIDGETFRADHQKMEKSVAEDTIAIVATAGSWPTGVIDPLQEIGEIAQKRSLYYHVDAAWGGLICPWLRLAGYDHIPEIGFQIPAVSSISVDPHKQGFTILPSGSITFTDAKLKELAGWRITEAGFSYETAGILGSRPGFSVAAAWAVFNYLGKKGLLRLSKKCYDLTMKLISDAEKIPGITFPARPSINLTTMTSEKVDMTVVKQKLRGKGWMFFESNGKSFTHENGVIFAVFPYHERVIPKFLRDLETIARMAKNS